MNAMVQDARFNQITFSEGVSFGVYHVIMNGENDVRYKGF